MNKLYGIIVFGTNGSGKTTLGRELARFLNFNHIDHEKYAFNESEIPYTNPRSGEECIDMMLADIEKHGSFVISAVTGDFGKKIVQLYKLAVFMSVPHELRIERIKQREIERYGNRVLEGGDMYEQTQKFYDFIATRPLARIEKWAESLICPIIHMDGTNDYRQATADIANRFYMEIGQLCVQEKGAQFGMDN